MSQFAKRALWPRGGLLLVFGSSALGGFAYRYVRPSSDETAGGGGDASELNPYTFTPFTLVDKQPVSSTSNIFTLWAQKSARAAAASSSSSSATEEKDWCFNNAVWSVEIKQPQLQIARAYTPLPPVSLGREAEVQGEETNQTTTTAAAATTTTYELRLLIRKEPGGELSSYIHTLPLQSVVELRGPSVEVEIPEEVSEVLFLAGGTGIAPAMQVAHVLKSRSSQVGGCRMEILWANRRREDCVGGDDDDDDDDDGDSNRMASARWYGRGIFGFWRGKGKEKHDKKEGRQGGSQVDGANAAMTASVLEKGPIVRELDLMKRDWRENVKGALSTQYFVDEEKQFIKITDVLPRLHRPAAQKDEQTASKGGGKVIFVSGPEGFIDYWAGKKEWVGGKEVQGPLRGVLGRVDLNGWKVWKL